MSTFLLPKALCSQLDVIFRKFWWGFKDNKKYNFISLAWSKISALKTLGGLGLSHKTRKTITNHRQIKTLKKKNPKTEDYNQPCY
jgi:hypothetical protein